jgi:mannosyltransferase OCH1-like enzyme
MEIVSNRLLRIVGALVKLLGYIFHLVLPNYRFKIPANKPPLWSNSKKTVIPKILWQTNYTDMVSLPVYLNYCLNRVFSLGYKYRYSSNEECLKFIKQHGDTQTIQAYTQLKDGASKADFWRMFVLNKVGGVYLDIDGHFVWPLSSILGDENTKELFVVPRRDIYTNYFLASKPNSVILQKAINIAITNIQDASSTDKGKLSVYKLTGPATIVQAIGNTKVNAKIYKKVCIQGNLTNEHFQYIDKKNGKWTHTKSEDILHSKENQ